MEKISELPPEEKRSRLRKMLPEKCPVCLQKVTSVDILEESIMTDCACARYEGVVHTLADENDIAWLRDNRPEVYEAGERLRAQRNGGQRP